MQIVLWKLSKIRSYIRIGVKISDCRGQCYDEASNMSGIKNGVATQIAKEEKRAVYTHCYAHSLNLAVGNVIKRSKVCSDALDVAFEITKLVKFSPKGTHLIGLNLKLLKRMGLLQELEPFVLLDGQLGAIPLVASLRIIWY